jgi:NCAIR mutase (PurE)-related protein
MKDILEEKNIPVSLRNLLKKFRDGSIAESDFIDEFKNCYFEDIGFAKIDHHRALRRGFPEVIFGQNKTPGQIREIALRILKYSEILLITRTDKNVFDLLKKDLKNIIFNETAGLIYTPPDSRLKLKVGITVICAGTTDIPVAEEAAITAYLMGNDVRRINDVGVAGLHRLMQYRKELQDSRVIVAVAGMEGALPGIVSSMVSCVVIGVPTSVGYGASFGGLSQLLTMLNSCSPGVLVTNIDNGFGAGYAAGLINRNTHND